MNISDFPCKPCMFTGLKSSFALCYEDGKIFQVYTQLDSAKYMLGNGIGAKIYEVVFDRSKVHSVIGEV